MYDYACGKYASLSPKYVPSNMPEIGASNSKCNSGNPTTTSCFEWLIKNCLRQI